MAQGALSQIAVMYNGFTRAEKKVADYVQKNPDKLVHTSITELAELCGVGDTTVFRLCKTLNYKGYSDFRMAIVCSMVERKNQPTGHVLSEEIQVTDSLPEVVDKVLAANISSLKETHSLLRIQELERAVDMMVAAEKILLVGAGVSLLTAMDAFNRFLRITGKVRCVTDPHLQACEASLSSHKDLVITVSYSGLTKDTVECARVAKQAGAKILAISHFKKSLLSEYADVLLLTGCIEGPLQGGSNTVKISQLYLFDILYAEYFKRTYGESLTNKEKTAASIMDKLY